MAAAARRLVVTAERRGQHRRVPRHRVDHREQQGPDGDRRFRTPFADWQMLFANLLPAHIMEKVGWDPDCATVDPSIDLSGGPFRITSVSPTAIVLGTNPRWWGTKPDVRTITVHIASGTQQLAQWVASNFVQVALPTAITPAFLDQMTSLPTVESGVQLSPTFLQLQMASGATSTLSADVRFAIALSVDRQALVNHQAAWALSSVEVASSNIYAQGESGYHAAPLTTSTTTPGAAPTTSTSTSSTAIVQGERQLPHHARPHGGRRPHGRGRLRPHRSPVTGSTCWVSH